MGEEVDRPRGGARIDDEVAPAAQLDAIGRVVAEVVRRETRVLVRFADVHRPPLAVGIELRPAVVAVDSAVVALGRDRGADGESRRDADGTRQRDEVGVEVGAVAVLGVARVDRIPLPPTVAVLGVAHLVDHVVVKRAGAHQVGRLPLDDVLRDLVDLVGRRHEVLGREIELGVLVGGGVRRSLDPFHLILDLDRGAAVLGAQRYEQNLVAVRALVQLAARRRRADHLEPHGLGVVRSRDRKPQTGGTGEGGELDPVVELELVFPADHAEQLVRRVGHRHANPRPVVLLVPRVDRLTVDLVDRGLGHRRRARQPLHEEIHVVNRTVGAHEIDAGELHAAAEIGQVLRVDTDQLQLEVLSVVGHPEVAVARFRRVEDVLLDRLLDQIDRNLERGRLASGRRHGRQKRRRERDHRRNDAGSHLG